MSKIIDQNQLVSMMNKTKWRELCSEFEKESTVSPLVKYKLITSDKEFGLSEVWWHELYGECQAIEWLDFSKVKSRENISTQVVAVLDSVGVPYSDEGGVFRVWGYVNSNSRPSHL
ncbi:DUF6678 family protein [Halioglobus japonicus]|uniref:DUF6678 family protein n=1 Tax=Halioglobus japonicus TaxID=930805 RepID=UPI00197AFE93|nr:DUF6678 family protein [Halioglobus japonicus]